MTGVNLLHQVRRLGATSRFDSKQVDSYAKGLRYLNTDSNIFITRQYQGIAYGMIPCQINKVSHNQGIDTLLFPFAVDRPEAEFGI